VSPKVSLVPQDNGKDSTNFNPRDTRFGLMAKSAMGDWLVAGRIETDFYGAENGNNLIPRLRLGYVDIGYTPWKLRVLAGQDWIPISQGNPNMAEFGILAASGNLWWRVPQVTVRKGLGTHWEVLASVMKHRRTNTANNDIMPWFLGRLAYTFAVSSLNGMLAVGGGWRDADYGTGSNPLDHTERWLITEEMRLTWGSFVLQGEFWYGDGLGGEWLRYDLDVNPATQKPIRAIGGWGDLTWNITSKLSVTAGYGIDDPADNEMMAGRTARELNDRQFTRNQSIYGNFFYRIASPVRVGVEIVHVDTQRTNTTDSGWRFNTVAELVF